jgi:hypothetical protein
MDQKLARDFVVAIYSDIEYAKTNNYRCILYISKRWYCVNRMILSKMTREDAIKFAKRQIAAVIIEPCGVVYSKLPQEIQEASKCSISEQAHQTSSTKRE